MSTGSIFLNNKTQSVRLPIDTRFPDDVKKVSVRVLGNDRIISPLNKTWDSFFLSETTVTDDFMQNRKIQEHEEREPF